MAEKPILFSTPMVQAIMEGRKTMTRKGTPSDGNDFHNVWNTAKVYICSCISNFVNHFVNQY